MQTTTTPQKSSTRAAAGAGIVFFSQIVGYGLYFLAQRVILSTMTKDAVGSLSYLQLMGSLLLTILVDAGMNNVALREMIARPLEKRDVVSTVLWLRVAGTILSALIMIGISAATGGESWTIILLVVFMISMSSRSSMLRAALELPFRESMSLSAISISFIVDWCIYVVLLYANRNHLTPSLIFLLQVLSALPATLYLSWRVRIQTLLFPLPARSFVVRLLRETAPQTAQLALQNVHGALDLYLVKLFAPIREIGILNAVSNMGQIILTAFVALTSTLYPMIADAIQLGKANASYRIERTLAVIVFVAVFLATTLCTVSPFIAYVFTKNVYADNILQFQLQFWMAVATCIAQTALLINSAQNERRAVWYSGLFLVIGSLSADYFLIPTYFSSGYIMSKMWSNLLSATVSLWFVGRRFGFVLIRTFVFRTIALLAVCVPYSFFVLRYWSQPLSCLCGALLCSATATGLGFLTRDELHLAQKMYAKFSDYIKSRNNAQV